MKHPIVKVIGIVAILGTIIAVIARIEPSIDDDWRTLQVKTIVYMSNCPKDEKHAKPSLWLALALYLQQRAKEEGGDADDYMPTAVIIALGVQKKLKDNPREAAKLCAEMNNLADKIGKVYGPEIEGLEELGRQSR